MILALSLQIMFFGLEHVVMVLGPVDHILVLESGTCVLGLERVKAGVSR